MSQKTTKFSITVGAGINTDNEELDELARQLVAELSELDEVSVKLARSGKLPKGAKGEPITIGTILIVLAQAGVITGLVTILNSWLSRDERRSAMIQVGENKVEVSGISKEEQANLVEWFQTQTGFHLEA